MEQGGSKTTARPIVSLLAGTARLIDVLPHLHQHAIDVTGGKCTLLFEHNPHTGVMQATSGFDLEVLRTDPWIPDSDEARVAEEAFTLRAPTLVADAAESSRNSGAQTRQPLGVDRTAPAGRRACRNARGGLPRFASGHLPRRRRI
jgi:hypothetical protein